MCRPCRAKYYSFTAACIMTAVFSTAGSNYAQAGPINPRCSQARARQQSQATLAVNSACDEIFKGNFESAQRILEKAIFSDSQALRQLKKVVDEYRIISARRKASQDKAYQEHINELEKLRRKGLSDDVNDIGKVFLVARNILEHADEDQKQALLRDPFLIRTIRQAKAKATELEAKGKWLDAYTICYSKLRKIYEENEAYSEHAEQLLDKASIEASLKDSPCETCEERYTDIEKQMFIKAVDFLDFSYVNIINYQGMAISAINHCKLLAEVMSKLDVHSKYKITNAQYVVWSRVLGVLLNEINQSQEDIGKDGFVDIFEQVLALNESSYTGIGLPPALLISKFAEGALSALDPYTAIYWPSQARDFEKAVTNQFSGIGIKFSKEEGMTKIVAVLPDTPAHKSGLRIGDIITSVDGIETKDIPSDCVAKRITGPEDTKVTVAITRSDENQSFNVTLDRTRIIIPSVHGWQRTEKGKWLHMIDSPNKIGYVRISSFNSKTIDDFEKALCQLEENGLKGLILDLRSNPGGLLSAAIEIADNFIQEGLIVRTEPRYGMSTYISAHQDGTHADYPIVILINPLTASSSEILAGALQDQKYNRAILVGQRSYGKGSVQSITNYCGNGAQLKYTAAYYHLPSGQRVESRDLAGKSSGKNWGISPNVNVKLRSNELQKIASVQKANELVETVGQEDALNCVKRYLSQETVDADPQLAIGLLVLKSKMIQRSSQLASN
jgi:carboxyl-terminal processing protease